MHARHATLTAVLASGMLLLGGCAASHHTAAAPTPDQALERLMDGNERFASGRAKRPNQSADRREAVADGQAPFAAILACADSRVGPEIVFDQGVGDLFVVRLAGNIADSAAIASMEFATSALHAPLIVVMGHTACGAVKATIDTVASGDTLPGQLPTLTNAIRPAIVSMPPGTVTLDSATVANVRAVVDQLRTSHPILSDMAAQGKVRIVGGVYNIETGRFDLVDTGGPG